MKKDTKKKEIEEGIEELLIRLRSKKGWSYIEIMMQLSNKNIKEKDIRKWELGLEYPNLDTMYELSAIYEVPVENFIQAKNNSYVKGLGSINMFLTKWICYVLDVSIKVGFILLVLLYVIMFFLAFAIFAFIASQVKPQF